ncbi:histidine phosphatase family protein [Thalassospira sp. CH_XMU1448-2]|uniref:histidine phosphatase family protein n=1 Tax=Thalassospira sp. CH_XMU1448-2 TaxID=3107773 RepID=UPI00300AB639
MPLLRTFSIIAATLICCITSFPAHASAGNAWEIWKQGDTHALMRHAIAPGTGDPANFTLDDCSTQRNLDDLGRNQARRTGGRIREMGIEINLVLSSQWCRCIDTASLLALGPVRPEPSLNSFFADRSTEQQQTRQIADLLATLPSGTKAMLVTHQVNITALTGIYPKSGEIILIRVTNTGDIEILARLMP